MKVRMEIQITGTRNGVRWPAPGGEVDLPDGEAADLCAQGFAVPVAEVPSVRAEKRPAVKKSAEKR